MQLKTSIIVKCICESQNYGAGSIHKIDLTVVSFLAFHDFNIFFSEMSSTNETQNWGSVFIYTSGGVMDYLSITFSGQIPDNFSPYKRCVSFGCTT